MEPLKKYLAGRRKSAFAAKVGIVPAYLSQILSGTKRPGFDLMVRIERETDGDVPVSAWVDHGSSPSSDAARSERAD
ncbi:helix-turn-helix domain-containing protein [Primorskyibacter flagellatus]|uniref:helix-turn-helix domain-containing protein n=1 Tax=Primorskyibacter flagellatus TaxID=1387277 RepID=UPI003571599A